MILISSGSANKIKHADKENQDTTHLSLGYASKRFFNLIKNNRLDVVEIEKSDVYRTADSIIDLQSEKQELDQKKNKKIIHLSISDWKQLRLCTVSEVNIAHLSWEQRDFFENPGNERYGNDMLMTLSKFDRIWTCAEFITQALIKKGFKSVVTFPTPICSVRKKDGDTKKLEKEINKNKNRIFKIYMIRGPGSNYSDSTSEMQINGASELIQILRNKKETNKNHAKIFLTQGNLGDLRKNIFSVMIGFGLFAEEYKGEAYLIVKTSSRTLRLIQDEMGGGAADYIRWGWWGSSKIIIIATDLTDEAQQQLYGIADFYICNPIAEGQNVPLQEAIQCGCLPVTPIHSAMSEYLEKDSVVVIESEEKKLNPIKYCGYNIREYIGNQADVIDIANACEIAAEMEESEIQIKVKKLQEKKLNDYTFEKLSIKLLNEIDGLNK